MRIVPLLMLIAAHGQAETAFGDWQMNAAKSIFDGRNRPKSLTVRIEPRGKGEIFTLDRIEADGRATSSSTILYLDGEPRPFQELACSGIQSSRRVDSQTVEMLRMCSRGQWIRIVLRSTPTQQLVLEITEHRADGRRFERRIVLQKREEREQ